MPLVNKHNFFYNNLFNKCKLNIYIIFVEIKFLNKKYTTCQYLMK